MGFKRAIITFYILILVLFVPQSNAASENLSKNKRARQAGRDMGQAYYPVRRDIPIVPGIIHVKRFDPALSKTDPVVQQSSYEKAGVEREEHPFFHRKAEGSPLSRISRLFLRPGTDEFEAIEALLEDPSVEWAEPVYVRKPSYEPNDPSIGLQYYISLVQAPEAWDIFKGDPTVLIGIVDTGVNMAHPDLAAHIWTNPGEIPGDGLDNDGNGLADDINGWDFANDDNDPSPSTHGVSGPFYHGTTVAGVAAAVTDNGVGIASPAFNATILPVKAARDTSDNQYIVAGYDGIEYAAFMGADIINCSFGGEGGANFERDIIEDAIGLGALVVAAAGNDYSESVLYPAGYRGVLSVAATDQTDDKVLFSNWDYSVDVGAPGTSMYTTKGSGYSYAAGTSYSSPLAASIAALVKGMHPTWTGLQVGQQVRISADPYISLPSMYEDKLGRGRVNAYRALTVTSPAIRLSDFSLVEGSGSNGDGIFDPGEQVLLSFSLTNYLEPATGVLVTISSDHSDVVLSNGGFSYSSLGTLASASNTGNPVTIQIDPDADRGQTIDILFDITADGGYEDADHLRFSISPTYAAVATGNVQLTITSTGKLGFVDYPLNTQGDGFLYNGENLLFDGAVLAATGETMVSDAARSADEQVQNEDFEPIEGGEVIVDKPGDLADEQGRAIFSDENAVNSNDLKVFQTSLAFNSAGDEDYVLLAYTVETTALTTLSNLYFGLFMDWDVGGNGANAGANAPGYDAARSLGYVYDPATNLYAGLAVVSEGGATVYKNVHNPDDIYDGYTDAEKWDHLSGGIQTITRTAPNDYSHVVGVGPASIAPGDSVLIGFALVGGDNLADLQANTDAAKSKWQEVFEETTDDQTGPADFRLWGNYPNPFNPVTTIRYEVPEASHVVLTVHNLLGREIQRLVDGQQSTGQYEVQWNGRSSGGGEVPGGVYFVRMRAGTYTAVHKMILLR